MKRDTYNTVTITCPSFHPIFLANRMQATKLHALLDPRKSPSLRTRYRDIATASLSVVRNASSIIGSAKSKFLVNRLIPLGKYVNQIFEDRKQTTRTFLLLPYRPGKHRVNEQGCKYNSSCTPDVSAWYPRSLSDQTLHRVSPGGILAGSPCISKNASSLVV